MTDPARDVDEGSGVEVDGERGGARAARGLGGQQAGRRRLDRSGAGQAAERSRSWSTRSGGCTRSGDSMPTSTGLILLTNDGELANRLTHPRYGVPKTYRVGLARPPSDADLDRLRGRGSGSRTARPLRPRWQRLGEREIEITIREGRKRQVRRMAEAIGQRGGGAHPDPDRVARARRPPPRGGAAARGGGGRRALERFRAMSDDLRLWAVRGATKAPQQQPGHDRRGDRGADARADRRATTSRSERMVSCIFTSTHDLNAEFPAVAARKLGLDTRSAALRAGDRRPRRDAFGDPRPGALLRAAPITPRPMRISARPRSCART